MENWKSITGYPAYKVSDHGRVRSSRGVLAPWLDGNGRPTVRLYRQGVPREFRVHGLVLTTFVGPKPTGLEACHGDGNPTNNALSNLRWDTRSSNQIDSVRHGTHIQTRKTHCPRGHALEGDNLVAAQLRRGKRQCRTCTLASRMRSYYNTTPNPEENS